MSHKDDIIELTAAQKDFKNKILLEFHKHGEIQELKESVAPTGTTLNKFFGLVKNLIDASGKDSNNRILLTETMPELNFFQDPDHPGKELAGVILTTVLRRGPASLVGGNDPFNPGRKDIKPKIIRKIISNDPVRPGEVTYIISKLFDNLVAFNICARTNKEADRLADWFEDLMEKNRWYFEANGFSKYFFTARLADLRKDDALLKLSFRPFKYYVRTETYYSLSEHELDRLIVHVSSS